MKKLKRERVKEFLSIRILGVLFMALLIVSCSDDMLTGSDAQPTIPLNAKDCYDFGTLLTGATSSTQRLIVYNNNKGTIELESVKLRGGDESAFRINVDGMAGSSFTRPDLLHIAKGDSLYILMEVTAAKEQQERERTLEDYLDIACNGRTTSVLLKATAMNVEQLRDFKLSESTRWDSQGNDKQIFGTLTIPEGVTLTVADSLQLFMHAEAMIDVYGTLIIEGASTEHPVQILGDRTDKMFDNLYYRDMVGQWGGIRFNPSSKGNVIDHAYIKGMSTGITLEQESAQDNEQQLVIRNTTLRNSNASLISATSATMTLENSCFMNSGEALMALNGGSYDITHCTLANYQFWTAYPQYDLLLSGSLYHCDITNTIVYGAGKAPNIGLDYQPSAEGDSIFHYRFDHCLLNANGEDDDNFISIIWGDDPLFKVVDVENYLCDPHLQDESPARGKGKPSTIQHDIDGKPRSNPPSIGCYE